MSASKINMNREQRDVVELLRPGHPAPDFSLRDSKGNEFSLGQLRGQPVVIAFYPADWSPVCGDQMVLYNAVLPMFEEFNAQLIGISVDSVWSHKAFLEQHSLQFPILSDFEPKGEVARMYGAYSYEDGTAERALFVIDRKGDISWSYLSPANVNPGADGILRALEGLAKREGSR